MSSLEIAKLTGKRHTHVLDDIVNMLQQVGVAEPGFRSSYIAKDGSRRTCYNLPRYETDLLITGYSIIACLLITRDTLPTRINLGRQDLGIAKGFEAEISEAETNRIELYSE